MNGGDIQHHSVLEIHVPREGKSPGRGFANQRGSFRILKRHHEIFAGAGADAIGEQYQAAVISTFARRDHGVGQRNRGVRRISRCIVPEKRASVLGA